MKLFGNRIENMKKGLAANQATSRMKGATGTSRTTGTSRISGASRVTALALAVATSVGMLAAPSVTWAANSGGTAMANRGVTKEETVYVVTGSNGAATEIIVSDHLKNPSGKDSISDISTLKDVKNVKSEETFRQSGDQLVWSAGGKDIYYQGSTDAETPIQMDVKYYMSDVEMTGAEMQGKEGDFVIEMKFTSNAVSGGASVPFVVLSGLLVQNDNYSNIRVSSGKVIDDGEKTIVAGMAAPGLADNLTGKAKDALDEVGLGDEIVISGRTTSFDITDIMTIATSNILGDADSGDFGDLDFDDQIKQLNDGASALVDGSEDLYDGLKLLDEKSVELGAGVDKLNAGAAGLKTGVNKLSGGVASLDNGLLSLQVGLDTMYGSIKGDGTSANPGLKGAVGSVDSAVGQLKTGSETLGESVGKLKESVGSLKDGAQSVSDGVAGLTDQMKSMKTDLGGAVAGSKALEGSAAGKVDYAAKKVDDALDVLETEHTAGNISDDTYNKLVALLNESTGSDGTAGAKADLANSGAYLDGVAGGLAKIDPDQLDKLKDGASAVNDGVAAVNNGIGTVDGTSQNLANGVASLTNGLTQLQQGTRQLSGGVDKLIAGFEGVPASGSTPAQDGIIDGMAKLTAGSSLLRSSVGKTGDLKSTTLVGGAAQLANGMDSLAKGKDTLLSGIGKLADGSDELSKGMAKLYKDGIKKIVDLYNDDLKGALDGLRGTVDAAQSYDNFSGIGEGMDGSVKFVFKTEVSAE